MPSSLPCGLVSALCAAAAAGAFAAPVQPTLADPLDPQAPVPQTVHRSALAGYRAYQALPPPDWRAANDKVGRIGGWRVYLREAQQPATDPAAGAHDHHKGH
jgi:hypothetical protein